MIDEVRGDFPREWIEFFDPAAAEPVLAEQALHAAPVVRVAAAVALMRAGFPWPDGTIAALVAAIGFVPMAIATGAGPRCSDRWRRW